MRAVPLPALAFTLFALGCPEPVPTTDAGVPGGDVAPSTEQPGEKGMSAEEAAKDNAMVAHSLPPKPTMAGGSKGGTSPDVELPGGTAPDKQGAPPTAGTFGDAISSSELTPLFSQEQLLDGNTIAGKLKCDGCMGQLLVRVLPPPPDARGAPQGGGDDLQLITLGTFPSAGNFEIKVPSDRAKVVLQVVDDANKDGRPGSGERMGMRTEGPVDLSAGSVKGVVLTVGVFPEMPAVDVSGNVLRDPDGSPEAN